MGISAEGSLKGHESSGTRPGSPSEIGLAKSEISIAKKFPDKNEAGILAKCFEKVLFGIREQVCRQGVNTLEGFENVISLDHHGVDGAKLREEVGRILSGRG